MASRWDSGERYTIPTTSTAQGAVKSSHQVLGKSEQDPGILPMNSMSSTVFAAMTKWVYPSVEPAEGQLRKELLLHLGNIGMWSILYVPNARSPSWEIVTTKERALPTAKPTTINYLETFAMFAIKLFRAMFSQLSTKHGVSIILHVPPVIRKWPSRPNSMRLIRSRFAKNVMIAIHVNLSWD